MTTFDQKMMLVFLRGLGRPASMQTILRARGVSVAHSHGEYVAVLQFMRRLEGRGLVTGTKHPGDPRLFFSLTPEGQDVADQFGRHLDRIARAGEHHAMARRGSPVEIVPVPGVNQGPPMDIPSPPAEPKRAIECPRCFAWHPIARVSAQYAQTKDFWCECGADLTKMARAALEVDG